MKTFRNRSTERITGNGQKYLRRSPDVRGGMVRARMWIAACALLAACCGPVLGVGPSPLQPQPTWRIPPAADVTQRVRDWLDSEPRGESERQQADRLWQTLPDDIGNDALLERVAATTHLVRPTWRQWCDTVTAGEARLSPSPAAAPGDAAADDFGWHQLALHTARILAQQQRYDQAFLLIKDLKPEQAVDPATLLFYQAVCQHRLVELDACRETLERLRENEAELPRRYRHLSQLLARDVASVDPDSLEHISRWMEDIGRRLQLGQADADVRKREDSVIEAIDKLIKKAEDAAKGASASSQGSAGPQPLAPAQDSRIAEGKGPGKVDPKNIGSRADWGNLPEKDREEAMQQIGRQFPAHYRDVVEQYFRKLASEASPPAGR